MGFFGGTWGRSLFFAFLISVFIIFTGSTSAEAAGAKPGCAHRIARAIGIGIVALSLGAPVISTGVGFYIEAPHVGHGIYFDWENVRSRLSYELQQDLANPHRNHHQFVQDLSEELSKGARIEDEAFPIFQPRMASEYIGYLNGPPVTCKHKALIMAAILQKAGIQCEVKWGKVDLNADDRPAGVKEKPAIHVWVYLPGSDEVADPMQGWVMNAFEYRDKYVVQEYPGEFGIAAKTVGLLVR